MTKEEGAIVMAYTGVVFGSLTEFHRYAEKLLKRSIFTHEFADADLMGRIRILALPDFTRLHRDILERADVS